MIQINFFVVFAVSCSLILADAKPANLVAIACGRNPNLAMCGGAEETGNSDNVRLHDAPDDEDTRFMRSFPKVDFDEMQVDRYCARHRDHYSHYCVGEGRIEGQLQAKLMKFCPSFEQYCPEVANKMDSRKGSEEELFRDAPMPLVVPPPLPSASHFGALAFDSPILDSQAEHVPERAPLRALSPALIKTCTPDCTAAHCTVECKCAYSHPSVHAKCNPPKDATYAGICQAWYDKCPMFRPVSY